MRTATNFHNGKFFILVTPVADNEDLWYVVIIDDHGEQIWNEEIEALTAEGAKNQALREAGTE